MVKFSTRFNSFARWLKETKRNSSYSQRIIRLHKLLPSTPLNVLRKTTFASLDFSKSKWSFLTSEEKTRRIQSLEVLRRLRKGESLLSVSKEIGLKQLEIQRYLGRALVKKSGRWIARHSDSIERAMKIYEKGKVKTIIVTNSKDAALIGEYFNAVRNYLHTGDKSYLKPFKDKIIVDAEGKKHKLETNPQKIRDIEEAKEDSEFFEVYSDE